MIGLRISVIIGVVMGVAIGATPFVQAAEPVEALPELVITADRATPLRSGILIEEVLRDASQKSLDGILRQVPGFSLFRRSDSLSAHPTSQGVSLGNTGPNGASRAVLLLDGLVMNDPFGGWIPWSRFQASTLNKVTLTPNGRADSPNLGLLCGSVALESRLLEGVPFVLFEADAGNFVTYEATAAFAQMSPSGRTRFFGSINSTDFRGYVPIRADQRGLVDINAFVRAQSFDSGVRHFFSDQADWSLTLRTMGWREDRGNGTPLTNNESESLDFFLRLEKHSDPSEWSGAWSAFVQRRNFSSTFTSISTNRSSETLSLDQYGVPATATGIAQLIRLPLNEAHVLVLGSEARVVKGETDERFRNLGAGFTRNREAGGNQKDATFSIADSWTLSPEFSMTGSVKGGFHGDEDGRLREMDLGTGALVQSQNYLSRWHRPVDFGLTAHWTPRRTFETEFSAFLCHRFPTLNELYRPFRVGNTLTLANPNLLPEKLVGTDVTLKWHPTKRLTLSTRAFYNELHDAIANVSEVSGPGTFGDWGVLAAGGIGARRENLDLIRIHGLEIGADFKLLDLVTLEARWLFSESRVAEARVQRQLEGLVPAQCPRNQATIKLRADGEKWRFNTGLRMCSGQFDDDLNQRRLASYISMDAQLTRKIGKGRECFVGIENLTGREIQSRRDADGTIGITSPRAWTAGLRIEF